MTDLRQLALECDRKSVSANEHSLADAFKAIALLAREAAEQIDQAKRKRGPK